MLSLVFRSVRCTYTFDLLDVLTFNPFMFLNAVEKLNHSIFDQTTQKFNFTIFQFSCGSDV